MATSSTRIARRPPGDIFSGTPACFARGTCKTRLWSALVGRALHRRRTSTFLPPPKHFRLKMCTPPPTSRAPSALDTSKPPRRWSISLCDSAQSSTLLYPQKLPRPQRPPIPYSRPCFASFFIFQDFAQDMQGVISERHPGCTWEGVLVKTRWDADPIFFAPLSIFS